MMIYHIYAYLFSVEMIPRWNEEYVSLLTIGKFDIPLPIKEKQDLVLNISRLNMLLGCLYKEGNNGILHLCIEPFEKEHYLHSAHVIAVGNIHMAGNQTLKRILWLRVWWPQPCARNT